MSLISCPECGKEISDKVKACPHCGYPLVAEVSEVVETKYNSKINPKYRKVGLIIVPIVIIAVIVIIIVISQYNNPLNKYKRAFESNNIEEVNKIYDLNIKGVEENETKVEDYLEIKLSNIYDDFNNSKTNYDNAISELNTIKSTLLVSDKVQETKDKISAINNERLEQQLDSIYDDFLKKSITYEDASDKVDTISYEGFVKNKVKEVNTLIDNLNNSRNSYNEASKYISDKDYVNALRQLSKVIEADENYNDAKNKINEYSKAYKNDINSTINSLESTEDYTKIVLLLKEALEVLKNDSELTSKKENYEELLNVQKEKEEQAKIDKYKNNQKMIVTKVTVDGVGFLNSNDVYVTVKNTDSEKVVKSYVVGMLCFDKNGYPIIPSYKESNIDYGRADANIQPNDSYGANSYWTIFSAEKLYVKACIVSVEYHDGTSWENEYFDYWLEDNKDTY